MCVYVGELCALLSVVILEIANACVYVCMMIHVSWSRAEVVS